MDPERLLDTLVMDRHCEFETKDRLWKTATDHMKPVEAVLGFCYRLGTLTLSWVLWLSSCWQIFGYVRLLLSGRRSTDQPSEPRKGPWLSKFGYEAHIMIYVSPTV
jgi:hypothetical protein